ncbi:MAG TPA: SRPBCC domain-containing protein [Fluviicola sp.]|nr:SRPBCC domain-containing protein [Fluviicola sp.]
METAGNREIRATKSFKVPLNLMWDAWSKAEHIPHWFGPNGFTCKVHTMDFTEGGEWNLTLHGADGNDFESRSVFREIIPFRKIVAEHVKLHVITTVLFEFSNEETHLDWSLEFDTAEMRDAAAETYNVEQGQLESIDRLEKYVAKLLTNDSQ